MARKSFSGRNADDTANFSIDNDLNPDAHVRRYRSGRSVSDVAGGAVGEMHFTLDDFRKYIAGGKVEAGDRCLEAAIPA